MALDTKLYLELVANYTAALDLTTAAAPVRFARQGILASGAGANAADLVWTDQRTISPSATDTLDLAGTLTGMLGGTVTFARIKGLFVAAAAANVTNITITRPATNGVPLMTAVSSGIAVKPGGIFAWYDPSAAGVAVTAATADLIDFVNSGATAATYDVVIIGALS